MSINTQATNDYGLSEQDLAILRAIGTSANARQPWHIINHRLGDMAADEGDRMAEADLAASRVYLIERGMMIVISSSDHPIKFYALTDLGRRVAQIGEVR